MPKAIFRPAPRFTTPPTRRALGSTLRFFRTSKNRTSSTRRGDAIILSEMENPQIRSIFLELFYCPSHGTGSEDYTVDGWGTTTYFGVTGAGKCRLKDLEDSHCGDYYRDGMFFPYEHVKMKDVTDGTSKTLAIGERVYQLRTFFAGAWYTGKPDNPNDFRSTDKVCSYASKNMRWGITRPEIVGYYVASNLAPRGVPKTILFNDLFLR